jgi:hypothetical protein
MSGRKEPDPAAPAALAVLAGTAVLVSSAFIAGKAVPPGTTVTVPTKEALYPRKELCILERRPPSAFVYPVVLEGLSTFTDVVQNSLWE